MHNRDQGDSSGIRALALHATNPRLILAPVKFPLALLRELPSTEVQVILSNTEHCSVWSKPLPSKYINASERTYHKGLM